MSEEATGITPTVQDYWGSNLVTISTVVFWLILLGYAMTYAIPRGQLAIIFLGGSIFIYSLDNFLVARENDNKKDVFVFSLVGIISVASSIYLYVHYWQFIYERPGTRYLHEHIVGILVILTVLYLSYRAFGRTFSVLALLVMGYGYFGGAITGLFGHTGLSIKRLAEIMVLNMGGFYGNITQIIAAWVALFLLYTGLVRSYGAFDLILHGTAKIANRFRSGVAILAVVSSMIIGSINGAPSANTAITGSITIPLMKRSGLPPENAAAIEATASTGGQIMPPIMGSIAFVMAGLLGLTYVDIVIAGLLPAMIYFLSILIGIIYISKKHIGKETKIDLSESVDVDELPSYPAVKFGLPFFLLVYTLGIAQWNIITAAMVTVFAQIATGAIFPVGLSLSSSREKAKAQAKTVFSETIEGFRYGALILAPIAIIIALINGFVDIFSATGLPGKLSLYLINITDGTMILILLVSMGICLLLGMGMPSIAAYTVVAFMVAPTLIEDLAIPELAAHYFVFYAAILSFITPPIANAVVVASGIAGSNFWKSAFSAIKLSAVLFLLPIVIIYKPDLVTGGISFYSILIAGVVLIGIIGVVHGLNYTSEMSGLNNFPNMVVRSLVVVTGLIAMAHPNLLLSSVAALVGLGIILVHYQLGSRKSIRPDRIAKEET